MKGLHELKPYFPRYQTIWDVSVVLNHLRKQPPVLELSLKDLTLHFTFLLCLLSSQRSQTINYLPLEHMQLTDGKCVFIVANKIKQSRVGKHIKPLEFLGYPQDKTVCVLTHIREYMHQANSFPSEKSAVINKLCKTSWSGIQRHNLSLV